jgi:hypothetical protein
VWSTTKNAPPIIDLDDVMSQKGAGACLDGDDDWVEAEIKKGLAGLSHLTLRDLEDEEAEELESDGCHGNKEVWRTCMDASFGSGLNDHLLNQGLIDSLEKRACNFNPSKSKRAFQK